MRVVLLYFLFVMVFSPLPEVMAEDHTQAEKAKAIHDIQQLEPWVQTHQNDYQAWFRLGVAYTHQQAYDQAVKAFLTVTKLKPSLLEPYNNLAVIYQQLGDSQAAVRELEWALQEHPENTALHVQIGDFYTELAAQHYKRAMESHTSTELAGKYQRSLHVFDTTPVQKTTPKPQVVAKKKSTPKKQTVRKQPIQDAKQVVVVAAIHAWRDAWSSQNVSAYLAAYDAAFLPEPPLPSFAAWEAYKHRAIQSKRYIKVRLSDVRVHISVDGHHASAQFRQTFDSNNYHSNDIKELLLIRTAGKWKIVRERVIHG